MGSKSSAAVLVAKPKPAIVKAAPPAPVTSASVPPKVVGLGNPDYMLSLERGLSVIRAFGEGRARLSIADVARATSISRAAARRCLYTLGVLGYVVAVDGAYELTPSILALGYSYLGSASVARAAQPILERLSDELHESCSLAVLDGDEIVYVARSATRRILSIRLAVGSRLPVACTSMGRVLIAYADEAVRTRFLTRTRLIRHTPHTIIDKNQMRVELERVRQQGFAIVDQELELGLRSLAVPVRRPDGTVMAAVNVGVHAARADRHGLQREMLPSLIKAAREIGATAGHAL
jgi:IclR family pca regulon transcriptional regulator